MGLNCLKDFGYGLGLSTTRQRQDAGGLMDDIGGLFFMGLNFSFWWQISVVSHRIIVVDIDYFFHGLWLWIYR